jgi:glutathione S-transferase
VYTLFYAPGACSLASHIILEELGSPFEAVRLDLAAGDQRKAEYLALNPKGRVPLLRGPQGALSENVAILVYLADRAAPGTLLPADPWARAQALSFLVWLSGTVHGQSFASVFRAARFTDEQSAFEGLKSKGRSDLADHVAAMATQLGDQEWAFGEFSIVDPMVAVLTRWGVRIGMDLSAFPALAAHSARLAARPAAARAIAREGIRIDG